MPRWVKITGIGCGGLLGLLILVGVVGALMGGDQTATETSSAQSDQSELEEAKKEADQARREAAAARKEATQAKEQAEQAKEEAEASDQEVALPEAEDGTAPERTTEKALSLQYEHINSGDYEAAYNLFTSQSKDRVSLEQYSTWFQGAGNYQIVDFSFPTVQVDDDTATLVVDLVVTSDAEGEEQYQVTQEMKLENETWRIVMRDEQVESFSGTDPGPPSQENNTEDSSPDDGVIVRVTGDPGIQFQGNIANLDSSRTVEGTTPAEFPVEVDQGFLSGDSVSANAQNMGGAGNLTVQIVSDGEVVKESSTSAEYGIAQVTWIPGTE